MKAYILKVKGFIALRLLCNALYILVIAGIPYIIKMALDYDYAKGYRGIVYFILAYLGIAVSGMIFQYFSQVSGWKLDQKFFLLIKHDMFCSILRRRNKEFREKSVQEYVSMQNNDIPTLQEYMESIILIIEAITQIIIYAVYLLLLDYRVAFVIMGTSCLCLFLPNITGKKLSEKRNHHLDSIGQYMEKSTDLLSGFLNINRVTRGQITQNERDTLEKMEQARVSYGTFKAFSVVLNGFCMYLLDIAAFAAVVLSLLVQRITIGTATAFLTYIKEFTFPIRSLVSAISEMKSTRGVKTKIFDLLSYQEPELCPVTEFRQSICFDQVTVEWEQFRLDEFTYCFEKGKKYAIIGHSGSGKSTLLHLLMQEEIPASGTIKLDGQDISGLEYASVLSYLSQREHIYRESFEQNVTVFHSYPAGNIQKAVSFLNIERLQNLIRKEDCADLSGGERNLLATVKMFVMDREIVLMDEIFGALDQNTRQSLQKSVYGDLSKTMLVVTHDITPENLQYFDEILIMQDGRLVCSGETKQVLRSREYMELKG